MNNKRRKNLVPKAPSEVGSLAKALVFAVPVTLVLWVVLLLAASAFAVGRDDPDALAVPLAFGINAVSAFAGGIISGKIRRGAGLVTGLATGLVFAAAMFVISLTGAYKSFGADILYRTLLLAIMLICACFGSLLSTRKKKTVHSRH